MEMLIVEMIHRVRLAHHRDGKSVRRIARDFHLSRNTVRKALHSETTEFTYGRTSQPLPKLGPYKDVLLTHLSTDARRPRRESAGAGYVLYAGGKMGRHPKLGKEFAVQIADENQLIEMVDAVIMWYATHGEPKERFADTLDRIGIQVLATELNSGV